MTDSNLPSLEFMKVRHKNQFNVKAPDDFHKCFISAMDITHDDGILLADHANISIKVFDQDGAYHASLVLANSPSDISAMSNDVAVKAFKAETPLLSLRPIYYL